MAVPVEAIISDSLSINSTLAQPASECVCPRDQRTVWNIIWSCLATTFLCTWVTVHPNIPAPDEEWWWIAWTRLKAMFWALVAPELILLWAFRQYTGAKHLKEKYENQYSHWTMIHGHFLQMGGFMLYNNDGIPNRTLLVDDFGSMLRQGLIEFPSITEKQIMDKSKGDALAKLLTLLQTGWFIAQCIARWSQHLAISEMEVTTLALATANLFIYIFWWEKPLDVRQPVPVHLLSVDHSAEGTSSNADPTGTSDSHQSKEKSWKRAVIQRVIQMWCCITIPSVSIATAIQKRLQETFNRSGLLSTIYNVLLMWPILEPANDLLDSPDPLTTTLQQLHSFYYYGEAHEIYSMAFTLVIAAVFGAIHCSAWAFIFPTFTEKILWRVSSITVVVIPFLIAFSHHMFEISYNRIWSRVWTALRMIHFVVYPLARLILLVEAVTTLRRLPPAAYDTVQWLNFIPHI